MKLIRSDQPQKTIAREAAYEGVGLHTGNRCRLVFKPAPVDTGIRFLRADLPSRPVMPATYKYVTAVVRGTTLSPVADKDHEARIHTVEHVLSALYCLGVDNLLIEIDANEPPVADGSAKPFIDAVRAAGLLEQDGVRTWFQPDPFEYAQGESAYRVEPAEELELDVTIDFKHPLVGRQSFRHLLEEGAYVQEISRARTFCFDYEVEALKRQGLARGGSLDNAVIVGLDRVHNKEKSLRYPDEFVRHKTLDLIGDLSLLGRPLKARVTALRPGHGHNVNVVRRLGEQLAALDGAVVAAS